MISRLINYAFLICGLIIMQNCVSQTPSKENKLIKLDLEVVRKGYYSIENTGLLTLDLRITNLNIDTVKFWIFNCSYLSNVLLESTNYEIVPPSCNSNYPELVSLKNNQSIYFPIIIKSKANNAKIKEKDKFGFVIIFENQYVFGGKDDLTDLSLKLRKKKEQMIWSKDSIFDYSYIPYFKDK